MKKSEMILALLFLSALNQQPALAAEEGVDRKVYVVAHVDINPDQLDKAMPVLQNFAKEARKDPSVCVIEVLQQTGAPNHFTIFEVLKSTNAYNFFIKTNYVKSMREKLTPLQGSPFDERLHHLLQSELIKNGKCL